MKAIEKQLIEHEGLEKKVYRCPAGKLRFLFLGSPINGLLPKSNSKTNFL